MFENDCKTLSVLQLVRTIKAMDKTIQTKPGVTNRAAPKVHSLEDIMQEWIRSTRSKSPHSPHLSPSLIYAQINLTRVTLNSILLTNQWTQRKTSRSRNENQQQIQPTYNAKSGNRTRDALVGGKCPHPAPSLLSISASSVSY